MTSQRTAPALAEPVPRSKISHTLTKPGTLSCDPMTTVVFPPIQLKELTTAEATALDTCAEAVCNLPYERWVLAGTEICRDKEKVLSAVGDLRSFASEHLKMDDKNNILGALKVFALRFTPPVFWPLDGSQSAVIFPYRRAFLINGFLVRQGCYGYTERPSWLQSPSSTDNGKFHCAIVMQDPSAKHTPTTQASAIEALPSEASTATSSAQDPLSSTSTDPSAV